MNRKHGTVNTEREKANEAGPPSACRISPAPRYRARLIAAGPVRTRLNQAGEMVIGAGAIRAAITAGQFEGLACFVDHAQGQPSLRNLLGVWHDVVWDGRLQAAVGTLTAYENSETGPVLARLERLLQDARAGQPLPDVGISLVFYPAWAAGGRLLDGFRSIESADIVFFPAANGRFLSRLAPPPAARETQQRKGARCMMSERMRLVAADDEAAEEEWGPGGAGHLPAEAGNANGAAGATNRAEEWLAQIAASGARAIIAAADLPEPVARRLAAGSYADSTAVHRAVAEARAELQALDAAEVVQLGPRPAQVSVRDPLERLQAHVDWFFGVPGTAVPPPTYRRLDQLYVALTGDSAFHGVFRPEQVQLAAATTSTLAGMAVNAMNKVIQAQFSNLSFWRWYERISWPVANDGSVQEMKFITFGGIGNLPTVAEGGAYTELTVDDQTETATFVKKGGYVGITLEMIRNSSIVQIQAVPRALAVAAVRTRSAAVSALFTANAGVGPTLDTDSKALFHADHNNVAATAFDQTAWRAARAECFGHTEVHSGLKLAVFPKFLLVPVDLYDAALGVFGYGEGMPTSYTPEAQARDAADPRPLPLVVPDWTDANNWAYVVDPQVYPVIQMSYAQAPGGGVHPAPELFTAAEETNGQLFSNDVLPIKVRDWFAVGVNGPRGIGKRNVA